MVTQVYHGTRYIDEVVSMRMEYGRVYLHQDANYNVTGLTDITGRVLERYYYSPYGTLEVVVDAHPFDYGERSERERPATGKADTMSASGPRTCPQGVSTTRATGGDDGDVDSDDADAADTGGTCRGDYSGDCRRLDADCGERSEREAPATGKADRMSVSGRRARPAGTSTTRVTQGRDVDGDPRLAANASRSSASRCQQGRGRVSRTGHTIISHFVDGLSGDMQLQRVPAATRSQLGNAFAHQGLLLDAEIGSYQNRARQYAPKLKRFVQRDPLALRPRAKSGYQDGQNVYAYLSHAPTVHVDPLGMESKPTTTTSCRCCWCERCLLLPDCWCCLCAVCNGIPGIWFVVHC